MVMERASKRAWISDKEMDEFDHITGDQIRGMTDLRKLKKLERYMREEGFPQTAEAAEEAIVNLGGRVLRSGERQEFDEHDEEFDSFLKSFDSWKDSINHADGQLRQLRKDKAGDVLDYKAKTCTAPSENLPSIRKASVAASQKTSVADKTSRKSDVRSGREYYQQWDAFAAKCEKEGDDEKKAPAENDQTVKEVKRKERNSVKSKSITERQWLSQREREKGNDLFKAKEYTAALDAYNLSIVLFSESAAAYSNRAAVYIKMNRWEEAYADCCQALKLDPKYMKAFMRRGLVCLETGRSEEALKDLKAALELDPLNNEVLALKQKAEREVLKLQEKTAKNIDRRKRISIEEVEGNGEKEEPAKTSDTLLKLEDEVNCVVIPKQQTSKEPKILIQEVASPPSQIEDRQKQKDSGDSTYVPMRVGPMLIEELEETRIAPLQQDEATNKQVPKEGSSAKPNHGLDDTDEEAERERMKGNELFKSGNFQAAIEFYNKSLSLDTEVAATYANRAFCFLKMKNWTAAKADCTEALKVDSGYAKAFYRRGLALEGLGDLRGALKDVQAALKMLPDDNDLLEKIKTIKRKLRVAFVKEVTKEEAESQKRLDEACRSDFDSKGRPATSEKQRPRPITKKRDHPFESREEDKSQPPARSKNFRFSKSNEKPKTTVEFQRSCEKLQNQPEMLKKYISSIGADEYPGIFKESLSTDALRILIKSLHAVFVPYDAAGAMTVLSGLSKVKRFGLILKLLSPSEKKSFLSLFDWLHHCCNEPFERTDELRKLCF